MSKRVLVTYATRLGSTVDVADDIALILSNNGFVVTTKPINEVSSVTQYDAVVIGSAIRVGHWLPEAVKFVKTHHAGLASKPVAYFLVCMTLREDTPENREAVRGYLTPVLEAVPDVKPVSIGMFAGAFKRKGTPFMARLLVNMVKMPDGDYRNYQEIGHWAHNITPLLMGETISE